MLEISLPYFCRIGADIRPLQYLRGGAPLNSPANVVALNNAKGALHNIVNDKALRALMPKAQEKAAGLLKRVTALLQCAENQGQQPVTAEMINDLIKEEDGFEGAVIDDLGHAYAFVVTDQRIISPKTMLDRPDQMFATDTWEGMKERAQIEAISGSLCLAFDCFTACGFHLLRSVEATIRQYVVAATGSEPQKRDWGHYKTLLENNGADPKVITAMDQVRMTERNPLMHPEDELTADQAIDLLMLCVTCISRLVGDMRKKGFISPVTAPSA